ncbi:efflux RND transporter periplasmic adaptor subunit [Legionella quateirensis]|uniref:Membrane-fusion protein n=1 Tax=Legionella quateirensis TaxID=45072 RepID=A0A378KZN6_9GAMM|nr:efflux RND transporter periplasmic adaptor subunit [Legionella quateirensis]KTD46234.1 membrane fusion protein [Legionella quateirensis]STY18997.1 Membrane-fusion protein [Legionella quateirensis]
MNITSVSAISFYCLCLITGSLLISCSDTTKKNEITQARPVQALQVGSSKNFNGRSFPGRATATQEVNLAFNVSGTLIELPVHVGDKVKTDALIARLDPKEFEVKLNSAKAEFMRDEKNFLRAKQLIKKGNISQVDYDLLESKLAIAQANLDLAEKALRDTIIKAPFNGKIANLYVENYQSVSTQQAIARLLDTSEIEMVIQIPENLISLIPQVQNIVVQFDAFPTHMIPAQIKEISNEASPDTRTYPVTLAMKQPKDIEILPGMAGKATGSVEYKSATNNTITVPVSALVTLGSDNNSYVWIIDSKTFQVHRRQVQIGELSPTGVTVLSGLNPDDWVVTAGVHSLDEGEKVTILNQPGN